MAWVVHCFELFPSAYHLSSDIRWGNSSEKIQAVCVGGFEASCNNAATVIWCRVEAFSMTGPRLHWTSILSSRIT